MKSFIVMFRDYFAQNIEGPKGDYRSNKISFYRNGNYLIPNIAA
jgi:hypothetical protein